VSAGDEHRPEPRPDGPSGSDVEPSDGDLADLALGLLDGRRRAELLAHLERCPRCLARSESWTLAADHVVLVAPPVDPPPGFGQAVLSAISAQDAGPVPTPAAATGSAPRRRRRVALALGAAAVAAVVSVGIAWTVGTDGSAPRAPAAAARGWEARLVDRGSEVGDVYVSPGHPSWLTMTISAGSLSGSVTCEIRTAAGSTAVLGAFTVSDGHDSWSSALPVRPAQVVRAELLGPGGRLVAWASRPR
jgi:hypothetical protein